MVDTHSIFTPLFDILSKLANLANVYFRGRGLSISQQNAQ